MSTYTTPSNEQQNPAPEGEGISIRTIQGWYEDTVASEVWHERREREAQMLANDQWLGKERETMRGRNQAALAMNQMHRDYYLQLGRQIRSRMEPNAKPRGNSDVDVARGLTDVMKYLFDVNQFDYEQTLAVKDQLICRGWIKVRYQKEDLRKEPIKIHHVPWRRVRVDPASVRYDLEDCKYIFEDTWTDLETAQALYPAHAQALAGLIGRNHGSETNPSKGIETTSGDPYAAAVRRGEAKKYCDSKRKRVKIVECWFSQVEHGWQFVNVDGRVEVFDEQNPRHVIEYPFSPEWEPVEGPYTQHYFILFCGDVILGQGKSPYTHGMYPYFLFEGYRADIGEATEELVPNEPFSMLALMRDPQLLLNSTYTKIRHILNTRQILMTKGVANRENVRKQAADPSGIIELDRELSNGERFEFVDQLAQASQLMQLTDRSQKQMEASSGINEASRGIGPEQSGRALFARQHQSEQTNTVFVDNQRRALILIGRALVSMIQQSYTAEKIVRITEDLRDRVVAINVQDPMRAQQLQQQGIHQVFGSVSQGVYDIIIDDLEASASRREQDNEFLANLMQNVPPEMNMALMDLMIQNTEMRNREEIIARIKMMQTLQFGPMLAQAQMASGGAPPGGMPAGPPNPNELAQNPEQIPQAGLLPGEQPMM